MKFFNIAAAIIVSLFLAGCGGGGSDDPDPAPTFSSLSAANNAAGARIAELIPMKGIHLPTSGVEVYSGYIHLLVDLPSGRREEIMGQMTASIDFDTRPAFDVTMFSLIGQDIGPFPGAITIPGARILTIAPLTSQSILGTPVASAPLTIDTHDGIFRAALLGKVWGDANVDGIEGGLDSAEYIVDDVSYNVDGKFVLERVE